MTKEEALHFVSSKLQEDYISGKYILIGSLR